MARIFEPAQDRATPVEKFNKEKFEKDKRHRRLIPKEHLNIIDGMEVIDNQIDYVVSGIKFYIYPVLPEWCEEEQDGD